MASTADVLPQIERAFADTPRPADDQLLHPDARDDNDIKSLYGVAHWHDLFDEAVEYECAALFFLGPAVFRHFLPAYMSFALRHEDSGAAVVGSTVYALRPAQGGPAGLFPLEVRPVRPGAAQSRACVPGGDGRPRGR